MTDGSLRGRIGRRNETFLANFDRGRLVCAGAPQRSVRGRATKGGDGDEEKAGGSEVW